MDASASYDPDGDISVRWFHYKDVTATQRWSDAGMPSVILVNLDEKQPGARVPANLPSPSKRAVEPFSGKALVTGQTLHFILGVKDDGSPPWTTYKRVILPITNPRLLGGRDSEIERIADVPHNLL